VNQPRRSADQNPVPLPSEQQAQARPLHRNIAERARRLWENYGRPEGRDVEIWLEAENQLLGVDPKIVAQGGGSVSAPALRQATAATPPTSVRPR